MTNAEREAQLAETHVFVRFGEEGRLVCAAVDRDMANGESDLVVVRDSEGLLRAARIVGWCHQEGKGHMPLNHVVARFNINPVGSDDLANDLSTDQPINAKPSSHRWGALGLPNGDETRVSAEHEPLESDADYAFQSAGYVEAMENRIHQLVPGDACGFRGTDVLVSAIDRRNNSVELIDRKGQSVVTMPLDDFIKEEERP